MRVLSSLYEAHYLLVMLLSAAVYCGVDYVNICPTTLVCYKTQGVCDVIVDLSPLAHQVPPLHFKVSYIRRIHLKWFEESLLTMQPQRVRLPGVPYWHWDSSYPFSACGDSEGSMMVSRSKRCWLQLSGL
jgi:hypothetical protein